LFLLEGTERLPQVNTKSTEYEIYENILTAQEVLGEFLNFFSSKGAIFRSKAVKIVSAIQSDRVM
jgi:hypothetical protein